jgi:hypothetical protein
VDDETGLKWSAAAQTALVDGAVFTRSRGTFDLGFALPAGHASIWFRQAAGFSPHDRDEPFANFYFGGFGNNYVDRGEVKRYREPYSLAGLELNEIGGRNFVKSTIELNLPPLRFERLGTPGFYVPFLRPALFVSGLATNLDHGPTRRRILSSGAQLDASIAMLSALEMTFSVGAGIAIEDGQPPRRELMLSLKVLR